MNPERQSPADLRDNRSGAYDAVNEAGKPQPEQVKQAVTAHQAAQPGADVRPDPVLEGGEVLPEGLRRPPKGPLNPTRGRGNSAVE
jgi:hypothetical protein